MRHRHHGPLQLLAFVRGVGVQRPRWEEASQDVRARGRRRGWALGDRHCRSPRAMRAPTRTTLRAAAAAWLAGAEDGTIRSRSGAPFKPSTLRLYAQVLRHHVLPELGGARLSEVRAPDIQDLVDRLDADSVDPATVRNAVNPLRG